MLAHRQQPMMRMKSAEAGHALAAGAMLTAGQRRAGLGGNPAVLAVVLYLLAWFINDPLAIPVGGGFTITPTQVATVAGIGLVLLSRRRRKPTAFCQRASLWFLLYFASVLVAFVYAYMKYDFFASELISIGANVAWFLVVAPHLSAGISRRGWRQIQTTLVAGGAIVIVTGLWEFWRGAFLITSGPVMSHGFIPGVFWIRGLHEDRIDYATNIAMALLVIVPVLIRRHTKAITRAASLALIGILLFLLVVTQSWTGIAGTAAALVITSFATVKGYRRIVLFLLLLITGAVLVYMLSQLPIVSEFVLAFQTKYTRQVDDYATTNFRYLSILASLRGFASSPFLGIGLGRSGGFMRTSLGLFDAIMPHTAIANVLLEQGLVGAVPFLGLGVTLYRRVLKYLRYGNVRVDQWLSYRIWVVGMGVFILIRSLTYFHYLDNTVYFVWAALLAARPSVSRPAGPKPAHGTPLQVASSTAFAG